MLKVKIEEEPVAPVQEPICQFAPHPTFHSLTAFTLSANGDFSGVCFFITLTTVHYIIWNWGRSPEHK